MYESIILVSVAVSIAVALACFVILLTQQDDEDIAWEIYD